MGLFKKSKKTEIKRLSQNRISRIYQYSSGEYLPDTSQPNPDENYEIKTADYTPHSSVRFENVVIGSNGKALRNGNDTDRELPKLYSKRYDCCGCSACYAICPVKAISMRPDEEGFLYPVVNAESCVRCYKCISVCLFRPGV